MTGDEPAPGGVSGVREWCERASGHELTPAAEAEGLTLTVVGSSHVVRSDPVFLRRILQTLVTNAIRYTETGRILIQGPEGSDTVSEIAGLKSAPVRKRRLRSMGWNGPQPVPTPGNGRKFRTPEARPCSRAGGRVGNSGL